jgi:prephenate dehydratase
MRQDYPTWRQESGSGDYIDTARAAQALAHWEIPAHYAICGPRLLADMYGFDVIQSDMQDSNDNITTFLLVTK